MGVVGTSGAAAVMREFGGPLAVEELPLPEVEPGALLVRVRASTVCGSDVHTWLGHVRPVVPIVPPLVLGHEIVGEVVFVGAGADRDSLGRPVAVGDRVVWEHEPCRHCEACVVLREPTLCGNRRVGMFHRADDFPYVVGGFSQYSYVWPGSGRVLVPESLSDAVAASGTCALRTAISAVQRIGPVDPSHRVLIQGSGPLGLYAAAVVSRFQPKQVIVVGAPTDRLGLARQWGATDVVGIEEDATADERVARIVELTSGGPDVIFEMSGGPSAFSEGVAMARKAARYMVVGTIGGSPQSVDVARIVGRQLTIRGTLSSDIGAYVDAMDFLVRFSDELGWERLLTGRVYGLAQTQLALEQLHMMAEMKPVVDPWA